MSEMIALTPPPTRRWLVLLAMTGSLSMIFVDITVTGVALPSIGADLGVTTQALSWVTNAYLVALAALMALGGRTGDIIGKRSAFLAGVAQALCAQARRRWNFYSREESSKASAPRSCNLQARRS